MNDSAMDPIDTNAAAAMWDEYCRARPGASTAAPDYTIERFGDNARLANELIELVISGRKRATADLIAEFVARGDRLPQIGGHWIVCDASGAPRVILRTTELRLGPFSSIDESFAFDEGEDERTLEGWVREHRIYFARVTAARGESWTEEDEVVFERFAVVWPLEYAN